MGSGNVAGTILAGGRSRRMGGGFKALLPLAGKPLISHVIERVQPQLRSLVLSVERNSERFAALGLPQVEDPLPGSNGPLGGLLAALTAMDAECDWLLLVPCDAPFLPRDMGQRLLEQALGCAQPGCVIQYDAQIQPTFSIWHRRLQTSLEKAVLEDGMAGFKQFLRRSPVAVLDWEYSEVSPFFNINDSEKLAVAAGLLDSGRAPI